MSTPCWDCGSTIENHHTPRCDLAEPDAVRDLPQVGRTQWWAESRAGKRYASGVDCKFHSVMGVVVNADTRLPGNNALIDDA